MYKSFFKKALSCTKKPNCNNKDHLSNKSSCLKSVECCGNPLGCTLDVCSPGQICTVKLVKNSNLELCRKLLSMGIVSGTIIKVLKFAPLGDPMKIEALGYKLSLRLSEASAIEITRTES